MEHAHPIHREGVRKAHEMGTKIALGTDGGPGDAMVDSSWLGPAGEHVGHAPPRLYVGTERLSARLADRLIAVSRPNIQTGIDLSICSKEKFALIYYGIPLEKFRSP